MEFTKGMVVRSIASDNIVAVTKPGLGTFHGVVIFGDRLGEFRSDWMHVAFHPFDLQSAIEEALKTKI